MLQNVVLETTAGAGTSTEVDFVKTMGHKCSRFRHEMLSTMADELHGELGNLHRAKIHLCRGLSVPARPGKSAGGGVVLTLSRGAAN